MGSQLGYGNSPSKKSKSLNMGSAHISEMSEVYVGVSGKEEKKSLAIKIDLVWTMRWFKGNIKIFESGYLGKWCHTRTYFRMDLITVLLSLVSLG